MGDKKLYRIGELAKLTGVSPRTIDYYTTIGLIKPEDRSDSNYRLYGDETVNRLKRIEYMKKEKYTLEEIKTAIRQWGRVSSEERIAEKFTTLQLHLNQLEREIKELNPVLQHLKPKQIHHLLRNLTPHGAACMKAMLLLLGMDSMIDLEGINEMLSE